MTLSQRDMLHLSLARPFHEFPAHTSPACLSHPRKPPNAGSRGALREKALPPLLRVCLLATDEEKVRATRGGGGLTHAWGLCDNLPAYGPRNGFSFAWLFSQRERASEIDYRTRRVLSRL